MYTNIDYNLHGAFPLLYILPCWFPLLPFLTPFHLLGALLAVTGAVHLGLRLLVNWPPLSQPSPQPSPLQIPRTQVTQRLTKTTLRIRHLLSGTRPISGPQVAVRNQSFHQISNVSIPTTSVGQFVLQHPSPPLRLWEMVSLDVLRCSFVHRMLEQFYRHIQNPHSEAVLIIPISALQAYSDLRNHHKKSIGAVSSAGKLLTNHYCVFKWWLLSSG